MGRNILGKKPPGEAPVGDDGTVFTARAGKGVWAGLNITEGILGYSEQTTAIAATQLTSHATPGKYLIVYDLEVTTADAGATSVAFQVNYTDRIGARTWNQTTVALTAQNRQSAALPIYLASGQISIQTNVVTIGTSKYALSVSAIPC